MALDPQLLEILACPEDKGPLLYFADEESLYNPRLLRRYAVRDGIPIMLMDEAETVGDDEHQRLMAKAEAESIKPSWDPEQAPAGGGASTVSTDVVGFSANLLYPADNSGVHPLGPFSLETPASPHVSVNSSVFEGFPAGSVFAIADGGIYTVTLNLEPEHSVPANSVVGAAVDSLSPPIGGAGAVLPAGTPRRGSGSFSFTYYFSAGDTIRFGGFSEGLTATFSIAFELYFAKVG